VAVGFGCACHRRAAAFDIAVKHTLTVHEVENLAGMAAVFGDGPYRMTLDIRPSGEFIDLPYVSSSAIRRPVAPAPSKRHGRWRTGWSSAGAS